MPTYEYACEACGRFDIVQPITEEALKSCPTCGRPVKRLISRNVNILFKGSGFHITDYRSAGYTQKAGQETGTSNGASSGTSSGSNSSAAS